MVTDAMTERGGGDGVNERLKGGDGAGDRSYMGTLCTHRAHRIVLVVEKTFSSRIRAHIHTNSVLRTAH